MSNHPGIRIPPFYKTEKLLISIAALMMEQGGLKVNGGGVDIPQ
jgi:hypothetical protein